MPYKGLPLVCERCGRTFTRPPSLKRHLAEGRCPGREIVPARPRPRSTHAEIVPANFLPGRPTQSEGCALVRIGANKGAVPALMPNGDRPPAWWEPQADSEWRLDVWTRFPPEYRNRLLAVRVGAAFTIRPPEASNKAILYSQYHALKALATRLDAGIGTERERIAFEAGLKEYDVNYDHIQAQRKS